MKNLRMKSFFVAFLRGVEENSQFHVKSKKRRSLVVNSTVLYCSNNEKKLWISSFAQ